MGTGLAVTATSEPAVTEHEMHTPSKGMHDMSHADHPSDPGMHEMHTPAPQMDDEQALKESQAAIGRQLGDYVLTTSKGQQVKLSDYFDKPVVISLIYTSCYHICPTITKNLAKVVQKARGALGHGNFHILTIGFDTPVDTPEAMAVFAEHQKIDVPEWDFLSTDAETIQRLTQDIGFIYFRSPKGYDHLTQATIVERGGKVAVQVYGDLIKTPAFIEPLKRMVFGGKPEDTTLSLLTKKVKLFCTTYDPSTDSYHFDYSLFIGMFIGFTIIASGFWFLIKEFLLNKNRGT